MITVHIHEEEGLDSNFATKKVSSGKTGQLIILMRKDDARYTDKVEQNGDFEDLMTSLANGVRKLNAMLEARSK